MYQTTFRRAVLISALLSSLAACGGSNSDSAASTGAAAIPASVAIVPATPPATTGTSSGAPAAKSTTAAASPSTNGTMVTSATGQIVDSSLNQWSIKNGVVYEGTAPAGNSANVTSLLYYSGKVYQENASGGWWVWNGSAWVASTNPEASTAASSSSGASSSSSSSSGGTTAAASGATGTPAALLNYINSLSGQTKHILSGQHTSYWDSNPMDYEQSAASQTGKSVAILGVTSGDEGSTENTAALANAWLAKGGIPLVSWWPSNPYTGAYGGGPVSSSQFGQLTQPGTAAYVAWYKLLDQQIAILKSINGPVLYRPFVEMNGNWSWWGAQPTAEMVTVQQQMHDYFVSQGVTNILWVFNVNDWNGNYTQYYPGSAYADIVSWDAYPPQANDPTYAALVTLNKPIMLAESGVESADNNSVSPFSGDNSQLLATVKTSFPKVFAVVLWCQNWALPEQNGEAAFMNDSAMISLGDLPSGLVDP